MAIEKHVADAFRLDEEGWARHANPWSAWSRFATGIPMPIVAIWSREWIGWWAVLAFAAVALWLWLNPRLFPPVDDDRGWMSRGVFGERALVEHRDLANDLISIRRANGFNIVAGLGLIPLAYGLWMLDRGWEDVLHRRDGAVVRSAEGRAPRTGLSGLGAILIPFLARQVALS